MRGGAGRRRRRTKGRRERAEEEEEGVWKLEHGQCYTSFTLRGNFRLERPGLSTIQTPGFES